MAKRWIVGGSWAILMTAGVLMCGRYAAAEQMPNKVEKVTFLGAKHIKQGDLQNITGIRAGMPLNPNLNHQGCQKIIAKYQEMGRPFTSCALVKGGDLADTEVVYEINEGPKTKVRDIQFTGNSFVSSARLATQMKSSKDWFRLIGGTYNKQRAEADVNELYKYFRSYGYQDARIALETQRSAEGSEITLIFHIQEGPRYRVQDVAEVHGKDMRVEVKPSRPSAQPGLVKIRYDVHETPSRIGTIRVAGNKRISSESILAHVPLVPGQVLSYGKLKQAEQNLAELGLFVIDAAADDRGGRCCGRQRTEGSAYHREGKIEGKG